MSRRAGAPVAYLRAVESVARVVLALEAPDVTEEVMHFLAARTRTCSTGGGGDFLYRPSRRKLR
jgi:hypothetical protein